MFERKVYCNLQHMAIEKYNLAIFRITFFPAKPILLKIYSLLKVLCTVIVAHVLQLWHIYLHIYKHKYHHTSSNLYLPDSVLEKGRKRR